MRRAIPVVFFGLLLSGCAASSPPNQRQASYPRYYAPAAALALTFNPPVPPSRYVPDLDRDDRQVAAYSGFESLTVEPFDVQIQDDQEFYTRFGSYERRVTSDRYGVVYR